MHYTFSGKYKNGEATLCLGVGRDHGQSLTPDVKINRKKVVVKGDVVRGYDQHIRKRFFCVLELLVNMEDLKTGDNKVEVTFPDNGGHITSAILQGQMSDKPL
ncbi:MULTISPECIES: hypothetical protein [unclassified Saccharicrinis]|uniref:hypothetical protein n=1 Tax=unclassified Saccharicrinis TaxID=2646859 RepID=UPI003D3254D1